MGTIKNPELELVLRTFSSYNVTFNNSNPLKFPLGALGVFIFKTKILKYIFLYIFYIYFLFWQFLLTYFFFQVALFLNDILGLYPCRFLPSNFRLGKIQLKSNKKNHKKMKPLLSIRGLTINNIHMEDPKEQKGYKNII